MASPGLGSTDLNGTDLTGTELTGTVPAGVVFTGLGDGQPVPFEDAWEIQRAAHAARVAGTGPDIVFLLEHESVYTAGRRTKPGDRPTDGSPVVEVDRGGRITWHGPGQLIGYPIVALPDPVDVVAHVRRLEQVLIDACAELGLATTRVEGRSGVWVAGEPDRKVAAIGTRVARGVTMHGFAFNLDCDLSAYDRIVPCGLDDAGVTTVSAELGRRVGVADVLPRVRRLLADQLAVAADPGPTWPRRAVPVPAGAAHRPAGTASHPDDPASRPAAALAGTAA